MLIQDELRDLRRFSGPGFTDNQHYLRVAHSGHDFSLSFPHRQFLACFQVTMSAPGSAMTSVMAPTSASVIHGDRSSNSGQDAIPRRHSSWSASDLGTRGSAWRAKVSSSARRSSSSVAVGGGYVVSGSDDRTVRCLDLKTGEEVWKYEGHSNWVFSVAVSGGYVVSGSADKTVRCLELATGKLQTGEVPHDAPASVEKSQVPDLGARVTSVMIVQEHKLAVAGCSNGTLGVFRLDDRRPIATLVDQHTFAVYALATADDGDTLLSGSTKIVRTDLKALTSRGTIVASVELEDYNDRFKRFMSLTKPHLDYKLKALKELYTTAQLASFGFTAASVPEHKELREAMRFDVLFPNADSDVSRGYN